MLGPARLEAIVVTGDAERAKRFYRDTLGLPLVKEDDFALRFALGDAVLRVSKAPQAQPSPNPAAGFGVVDIGAVVDGLLAKGVAFERYAYLEQDARGVWTGPDGTRVAFLRDPDGNLLALAQYA